jgi:VanZ family protein
VIRVADRSSRRAARFAPGGDDAVAAIVAAGIVYASLARRGWVDCSRFAETVLRESLAVIGGDLLGNVFAYLLLGLALGVCWLRRFPSPPLPPRSALAGAALVVGAGALLSLSMEVAQACLVMRTSSIVDVGANGAGTAIGWFAARVLHPPIVALLQGRMSRWGDGRLGLVVALATVAGVLVQTAPWVPAPTLWVIRHNAAALWHGLGIVPHDAWSLAAAGAGWLALGLGLAMPPRRPAVALPGFCALAALVVGWRLSLPLGEAPPPSMVATLPVAVLLVATVPLLGRRAVGGFVAVAALIALLAVQLHPAVGPIRPFRWRAVMLSGDPIEGIRDACFFGWFAMTMVAGGRVADGRLLPWGAVAVAAIAATEWAQSRLPGHVGELSPIAIGLAGAGLAMAVLAGHGAFGRLLGAPVRSAPGR